MISEPWACFTDPDLFGDAAIFTDPDGNTFGVNGLFDEEYAPVFDDAINAEGKRLVLAIRVADLPDVKQGWTVIVRGNNYEVREIQPIQDGRILDLILKVVEPAPL